MPDLVDEIANNLLLLPKVSGYLGSDESRATANRGGGHRFWPSLTAALDRLGQLGWRPFITHHLVQWGCLPPLARPTGEDTAALEKYLSDRCKRGALLQSEVIEALYQEGLIGPSPDTRLIIGPIAACYEDGAVRPTIRHAEVIAIILEGALKQRWIDTARLSEAMALISRKIRAKFRARPPGFGYETFVFFYASPAPMEPKGTVRPKDCSVRNHLFAIDLGQFGRDQLGTDRRWSWRNAVTNLTAFLTKRILLWELKSLFKKPAYAGLDVVGALALGGVSDGLVSRLAGVFPLPRIDNHSISRRDPRSRDDVRHQRLVALSANLTIGSLAIILVAAIAVGGGWVADSWKFAFAILGMMGGAGVILASIIADDVWSEADTLAADQPN